MLAKAGTVSKKRLRTTNIVVAALGGEGGGVFTNWLVDIAGANNWTAQTTFLAGVAQRTGATIYYIELLPRSADSGVPVMSLFPAQGDIDIALSSEIAEAGRLVQRGFVTPARTTLISSTHRVYSINEKIHPADGTINPEVLHELAQRYARKFIRYDMQAIAQRHRAVISAALAGALAGSDTLPFSKQSFVDAIQATDRSVDANLAAFEDSYQTAQSEAGGETPAGVQKFAPAKKKENADFQLPEARTKKGAILIQRVRQFPGCTHFNLYHGVCKTVEYQDFAYAHQYLDEIADILTLDLEDDSYELTNTVARHLAVWMCFEDIARVARLKIRAKRMDEIREEVQAAPDQIIHVTEYFHPRLEEICAILPAPLGRFLMGGKKRKAVLNALVGGGKKLRTNTVFVFLLLRFMAIFDHMRRSSLGYQNEHKLIQAWLAAVKKAAQKDKALMLALAHSGGLVKGYSDTRSRTTARLSALVEEAS